jgi:hypothetical protein
MTFKKKKALERVGTREHSVENSLWKRTYCRTNNVMKVLLLLLLLPLLLLYYYYYYH